VLPLASTLRLSLIRRYPAASYFVLAYGISWLGAFIVGAPFWIRGQQPPKLAGLMMFPAMLLGPSIAGISLTSGTQGRTGLRDLLLRMRRVGSYAWFATLLIPPAVIVTVLLGLERCISPVFKPNLFAVGLLFGCAAGFFEEIGWMGFAFPVMRLQRSALGAAIWLGLLWALWHVPVIDYLGSATPHGRYWLPFFLAFTIAMSAIRILICWIYSNTKSILWAQMFHASSTGALAAFSPPHVTAAEEAIWYAVYGLSLWVIVAIVLACFGRDLASEHART
jgi:uncharacterized protein